MQFALSHNALALDEATKCAAENAFNSNYKELTFLGKFVEAHLMTGDFNASRSEEITFIKNNPDAALAIVNSGCASLRISYGLCDVDVSEGRFSRAWDEEADAVRHFVFSALLACARGKKFAERYTIAHEGPPPWDEPSKMDIHNNYVGFEWADPKMKRCDLPDLEKRLVIAALKALQQKKLVTLRSGDTACNSPASQIEKIEKLTDLEILDILAKQANVLRQALPSYCK